MWMLAPATAVRSRSPRLRSALRRGPVRRSSRRFTSARRRLLVTGVVTKNMVGPLQKTLEATPEPRVVIACGDCAVNGGIFAGAYGIEAKLDALVDVDVAIPGCPPHPTAITEALRGLTGR